MNYGRTVMLSVFSAIILLTSTALAQTQSIVKTVSFHSKEKPELVIFGSERVGYFQTTRFTYKNGRVSFKLVPPTYSDDVKFYAKSSVIRCLSSQRFPKLQLEGLDSQNISIQGRLRAPFYLLTGYYPDEPPHVKNPKGKPVVFVLNKNGEPIWFYTPTNAIPDADERTRAMIVKILSEDEIAVLHIKDKTQTIIERLTWMGNVTNTIDPSPLQLHHDFAVTRDGKILSFSYHTENRKHPWFFWRAPLSFLSTPLVSLDTDKIASRTVWDYLDQHDPYQEKDWTWNNVDTKLGESNFVHANSIEMGEQGYLLSLRNLNKIVLIDKESFKELWSIGPSNANTYPTKGSKAEFYRQHHASFLSDGSILLFDNGKNRSRVIILKLPVKTGSEPILVHQYIPTGQLHPNRYGSAFTYKDHTIVGFFPSSAPADQGPNRIIEFDLDTEKEQGRLEYTFGYTAVGYRAEPLEGFLGAVSYDKGDLPTRCGLQR